MKGFVCLKIYNDLFERSTLSTKPNGKNHDIAEK